MTFAATCARVAGKVAVFDTLRCCWDDPFSLSSPPPPPPTFSFFVLIFCSIFRHRFWPDGVFSPLVLMGRTKCQKSSFWAHILTAALINPVLDVALSSTSWQTGDFATRFEAKENSLQQKWVFLHFMFTVFPRMWPVKTSPFDFCLQTAPRARVENFNVFSRAFLFKLLVLSMHSTFRIVVLSRESG